MRILCNDYYFINKDGIVCQIPKSTIISNGGWANRTWTSSNNTFPHHPTQCISGVISYECFCIKQFNSIFGEFTWRCRNSEEFERKNLKKALQKNENLDISQYFRNINLKNEIDNPDSKNNNNNNNDMDITMSDKSASIEKVEIFFF